MESSLASLLFGAPQHRPVGLMRWRTDRRGTEDMLADSAGFGGSSLWVRFSPTRVWGGLSEDSRSKHGATLHSVGHTKAMLVWHGASAACKPHVRPSVRASWSQHDEQGKGKGGFGRRTVLFSSQDTTKQCVERLNEWTRRHESTVLRRLITWNKRAHNLVVLSLVVGVDARRTLWKHRRIGKDPQGFGKHLWSRPSAKIGSDGASLTRYTFGHMLGVEPPQQPGSYLAASTPIRPRNDRDRAPSSH